MTRLENNEQASNTYDAIMRGLENKIKAIYNMGYREGYRDGLKETLQNIEAEILEKKFVPEGRAEDDELKR